MCFWLFNYGSGFGNVIYSMNLNKSGKPKDSWNSWYQRGPFPTVTECSGLRKITIWWCNWKEIWDSLVLQSEIEDKTYLWQSCGGLLTRSVMHFQLHCKSRSDIIYWDWGSQPLVTFNGESFGFEVRLLNSNNFVLGWCEWWHHVHVHS